MAVQRSKLAINNARFPLAAAKGQRAVFVPQLDSPPRTPRTFMGDEQSVDYNTPMVIYLENAVPVSEGFKSVGYTPMLPAASPEDFNFDTIFLLRDENEYTVLYSPAKGGNYVFDDTTNAWAGETIDSIWSLTPDPLTPPDTRKVTYAYVDGKTFVCYGRMQSDDTVPVDMSIMSWNSTTKSLEPAGALLANVPFPVGEIDGIASSNGFLLMWSNLEIAWAAFNGTAFDYSAYANGNFTGSGRQIPEQIKGPIRAVLDTAGGFIMLTHRNSIAASYHAQNLTAPWVFRELPGAGGIESYEQATVESNLGNVFAYTTTGLQTLNLNSTSPMSPEVSDFIAAHQIDRYDFATHEIIRGVTSADVYTKMTCIGNRYLALSYGYTPGNFSYALIYDIHLKRWGKLRIQHRDCFYYMRRIPGALVTDDMLIDVDVEDEIIPAAITYTAAGAVGSIPFGPEQYTVVEDPNTGYLWSVTQTPGASAVVVFDPATDTVITTISLATWYTGSTVATMLIRVPTTNSMWVMRSGSASSPTDLVKIDATSYAVTPIGFATSVFQHYGFAIYSPETDNVFVGITNGISAYGFQRLTTAGTVVGGLTTGWTAFNQDWVIGAVLVGGGKMLVQCAGNGYLRVINLSTNAQIGTYATGLLSGLSNVLSVRTASLTYDPTRNRVIGWIGQTESATQIQFYLDLTTGLYTQIPAMPRMSRGIYIPERDSFVAANLYSTTDFRVVEIDAGTYALKEVLYTAPDDISYFIRSSINPDWVYTSNVDLEMVKAPSYPVINPEVVERAGLLGTIRSNLRLPDAEYTAVGQHSMAFLKDDGSVIIADWTDTERTPQDEAVIVLGRIQLSRSRNVQFNQVEVEGLQAGSIHIQPSYDGRNLEAAVTLGTILDTEDMRIAGDMIDCKNFNLAIEGSFDLSTVIFEGMPTGAK